MSKYYVGQRLRMKALEQDQGKDQPNEFVVTYIGETVVGLVQVKSPPGTLDTTRPTEDIDALFEPIPEGVLIPEGCNLVAVADGSGDEAELSLRVEKDGEAVALLAWPKSWPEKVTRQKVEQYGFEFIIA